MPSVRSQIASCFTCVLLVAGNSAAFDGVVEPVAVTSSSGLFGPGQDNSSFSGFSSESIFGANTDYNINRDGTVVFEGGLNSGNTGIWSSYAGSSPELLISRFGTFDSDVFGNAFPVPLESLGYPLLNDHDEVVFRASDIGGRRGIWELDRTAAERSATPRVSSDTDGALGPQLGPGVAFSAFGFDESSGFSYSFNNQSQVAFLGRTDSGDGVWRQVNQDSPEPLLLNRTDGPLGPGLGPNIEFSMLGPPELNNAGDLFVATLIADREARGLWKVPAGGSSRELVVADDNDFDGESPFGFDFDIADVINADANGNAALLVRFGINASSEDSAGIGFAPVGKPAVRVAVNRTDGAGGPGLGPGIEFEFREFDSFLRTAVAGDSLAFVAPIDGVRTGIWMADTDGNLEVVAVESSVLTQVDVPRIDGLQFARLELTSEGKLIFLAGGELWQYADGQLTELIELGSELDLSQAGSPDIRSVAEVKSFDLHDAGWIAAQVRLDDRETALVRLNINPVPEPSSLALLISWGFLVAAGRKTASRF